MISFDNLPTLFLHLRKPHIDNAERYSHLTGYFESDTESESESDEFDNVEDKKNDFEYFQEESPKQNDQHKRKTYYCKSCEFKTQNKSYLWRHQRKWHQDAKLLCPECEINFVHQWQVAFHLENQHHKSSKYHCTKCDENHKYFKVYRDGRCFPYHKK